MVTGEDAIKYIKQRIPLDFYTNFSVVGSFKNLNSELLPKSDLDILFVVKNEFIQKFFDCLDNIMSEFCKGKKIKYSFINGPLKYENYGLLHFLIISQKNINDGSSLEETPVSMIKNFISGEFLICGESLKKLTERINLEDLENIENRKQRMMDKYNYFHSTGNIEYYTWEKKKRKWIFTKKIVRPNRFLSKHLEEYYKKHI